MDEIMSIALESGLWAALFCFLFLYMLKDSRSRENKYSEMIDSLSKQLGDATEALKVCEEIKANCEANLMVSQAIKIDTEFIREGVEVLRSTRERL
ncbi:MAG: hypothetical protein J1F36_03185 [Clostridiales bacterium]|nr:hypothetical protein [Clostridiales bacterium]